LPGGLEGGECEKVAEGLSESSIEKAKRAAKEGRVIIVSEDPEIAVFLGSTGDYVLIPPVYCSCKDFSINALIRGKRRTCYHLLSFCLAKQSGLIKSIPAPAKIELTTIVREIIISGRSKELRKLINISEGSMKE